MFDRTAPPSPSPSIDTSMMDDNQSVNIDMRTDWRKMVDNLKNKIEKDGK